MATPYYVSIWLEADDPDDFPTYEKLIEELQVASFRHDMPWWITDAYPTQEAMLPSERKADEST